MPLKNNQFLLPKSVIQISLLMLCALLINVPSFAQEQARAEQDSAKIQTDSKDPFEWQIALDFSLVYDPKIIVGIEQDEILHYFVPGLLIDLAYKDFFLQTNQRRSNALLGGTEFGYQLYTADDWQIDIIVKAYMQGFDSDSLIEYGAGDQALLSGLREREATGGISLRYSKHIDNALLTLDIAAASPGDDEFDKNVNGIIVDSFYSYLVPYRNWDIYLGAGLTYFSQDIVDYYIGVSASEVTEIRTEYTAEGGFRTQLEVYAHYPLSTSWSFNTGITQSIFSSNIKKSPIVETNHTTQVMVGVLYVF